MKHHKELLIAVFFFGLLFLIWVLRSAGGIPILAYHRVSDADEIYSVSPQAFAAQMQYLKSNGYTAVSLAELADGFAGRRKLPAKPVVITFDDGYEDNYLTALPIMEQYGMKGTVFVIAGAVEKPEYLSWRQIRDMRRRNMEIGSHTVSHIALTELAAAELEREIAGSKAILENQLESPVRFLAYPYGKFTPALFPLLQQAGYDGACTGIAGLNYPDDSPYCWKRINIPRTKFGLFEFWLRLLRARIVSLV